MNQKRSDRYNTIMSILVVMVLILMLLAAIAIIVFGWPAILDSDN